MINPLSPSFLPRNKKRGETRRSGARKLIDLRVCQAVFERIRDLRGGLLSSENAFHKIVDFLSLLSRDGTGFKRHEKQKLKSTKSSLFKTAPIGLEVFDSEGRVNAFMQFLLHVPGFAEAFYFVPRSWSQMQQFIDQYRRDQQERQAVSSANGSALFRFFNLKSPYFDLPEMCRSIFSVLQSCWEVHLCIEDALRLKGVSDLFIAEASLRKQIFAGPFICYDLDAFIEMRPDVSSVSYVAYVKREGVWYQCDNERITPLRSDSLGPALARGVLCHFKRISF